MEVKELSYDTAYRAVRGDHDAQMKVLEYYDSYINALATVVEVGEDGSMRRYVDEDLKATIQTEYLMGMYASNAGKSGREYFTPQEVSELLTKITVVGKTEVNKVYDEAVA